MTRSTLLHPLVFALSAALAFLLLWPVLALAADDVPPDATRLVLPQTQLIAAIVGSLVPALTYVLNHYAPWVSEPVKATVLVAVAAAAGALTTLFDAGGIPLTWETAQIVGTSVALALLAHARFWKPSGLAVKLGGGTNRQDPPRRRAADARPAQV